MTHNVRVGWFTGQLDAQEVWKHVTGANRMHGHMLDVVITNGISSIVQGTPVIDNPCLYDARGNQYRNEITFHRLHDVSARLLQGYSIMCNDFLYK